MYQTLAANPWLIVVCLALLIPISAIVCGTVSSYLVRVRRAELDASLKHAMLERGMSAEEIGQVLGAGAHRGRRRCGGRFPGAPTEGCV